MRWYLAGPMSGIPEQNYPAFRAACSQLRDRGMTVISPHETFHHPTQPNESEWQTLLKHDVNSLLGCQGIILLQGWTRSQGAKFELTIALTLGMQVRFFHCGVLHDLT